MPRDMNLFYILEEDHKFNSQYNQFSVMLNEYDWE